MKRFMGIAVLVFALMLAACSGKEEKKPEESTQTETTTKEETTNAPESTTETTTEETTEAEPAQDLVYTGEYADEDNNPSLEIAEQADGTYLVQLAIVKLGSFDDGVGEVTEEGLVFTATAPDGTPVKAVVTLKDQTAEVTFTEITWDLIQAGSTFGYVKTSDTPHPWSPVDDTDDAAFIGEFEDEEGVLDIEKRDDGRYNVTISIIGLCVMDDGIGELAGDVLSFSATDPAENEIAGEIVLTDDGAKLTFTDSTWDYLENGTSFTWKKTSDVPNVLK